MKISLIAIGTRMPGWVTAGFEEYQKRLPNDYQLVLHEVSAGKRDKHTDIEKVLKKESAGLLSKCTPTQITVALDRQGKALNTQQIAIKLKDWHDQSQDINLLIGGPEGIHPDYLNQADQLWSLSALTLPHPLVRVITAEQIYRAYSIIQGHPYHR